MTRERWFDVGVVVALLAVVAVSSWLRFSELAASPFPLGVDGFYYPVQVRSLLETGTLAYPASPLTLWWMMPFAAATDPITGAKLAAAIGCALVAVPAFGVGARLGGSRGAGLIAAVVATTSASSTYLSTEFVKQGVGLTVAVAAIWCVLRACETPSRRRILVAASAIAAALLAHKLAGAIVLAVGLPAAVEEARRRGAIRGRRLLYVLVASVALVLAVLVIGIIAPQRFFSTTDLSLVTSLVTSRARWELPALARPGITLTFAHEAAIGLGFALIAGILLAIRLARPERRAVRVVAWSFVIAGIVIGLPWLDVGATQGLGFRMRLAAFVPLALNMALCAGVLARWLSQVAWQRDAALVVLAIVIAVRAPRDNREGRILVHPALASAVMAASTKIPGGTTVIVPERQVMFMTAWYTRAPVALRPEHVPYGRRMRLLTLHFIEEGSPLEAAIDAARADGGRADPMPPLHARHRNGLVLVSEATWDELMAALSPGAREYWSLWSTI